MKPLPPKGKRIKELDSGIVLLAVPIIIFLIVLLFGGNNG